MWSVSVWQLQFLFLHRGLGCFVVFAGQSVHSIKMYKAKIRQEARSGMPHHGAYES